VGWTGVVRAAWGATGWLEGVGEVAAAPLVIPRYVPMVFLDVGVGDRAAVGVGVDPQVVAAFE
jgi:hypothetical protein